MRFLSTGTVNVRAAEENYHVPRFVTAYTVYLLKGPHTGHYLRHYSGYVGHVRYQKDAMQHDDVCSHGAALPALTACYNQSQYLPEKKTRNGLLHG